jgi:hypothetical protein
MKVSIKKLDLTSKASPAPEPDDNDKLVTALTQTLSKVKGMFFTNCIETTQEFCLPPVQRTLRGPFWERVARVMHALQRSHLFVYFI